MFYPCFLFCLIALFSFKSFAAPPMLPATEPFRVMTYNIHHGVGEDGILEMERIAALIIAEGADIVGLQEVDKGTTRVGGRDLAREIAELAGYHHVFYGRPYQGGQFGNAILSRFPIKSSDEVILPQTTGTELRRAVRAIINVDGRDFSFWTTHLAAAAADEPERLLCVELFNELLSKEKAPAVCTGDFNDFPDGNVHLLMKEKWHDAWELVGVGKGYTFPARGPNRRIDYVYLQQGAPIETLRAWVPMSLASDHLPLVVEMRLLEEPVQGVLFSFNEGNGSSTRDAVQNLNGIIIGAETMWSSDSPSGQPGDHSLTFNGTNRVVVADPNGLVQLSTNHNDYTLQAWVKLAPGYQPGERVILFQYEGNPGFALSITPQRQLHTTAFRKKDITSSAIVPNDGQWHHVAAVHHDKSRFEFFIDGRLESTVSYTDGPGSRDTWILTIGSTVNQANAFVGGLDRIRFTPRALSAEQLDYKAWPRELRPSIEARVEDGQILLHWPAQSEYLLESSTNLAGGTWSAVSHRTVGTERQVLVTPQLKNQFYRLKRSKF